MSENMTTQPVCQHGLALNSCVTCHHSLACAYRDLRVHLDKLLEEARPRLLRLARLNGIDADMADDVVQETFVEAWQHLGNLREPERFAAWLNGICRNVCRRQARARTSAPNAIQLFDSEDEAGTLDFDLPDPLSIDPSQELERRDMQILLDRALGYLAPSARELIELCYLSELPQREVAQRLDISLGALELRLHRARRQLRQVLNGELRTDATEFGLLLDEDESMGWQEMRRWCWLCGKQRMRGKFERLPSGTVSLRLRCPDCSRQYGMDITHGEQILQLDGLRSLGAALKRGLQSASGYFTTILKAQRCTSCQSPVQLRIVDDDFSRELTAPCVFLPGRTYLSINCPVCGISLSDLTSLLLLNPEACNFFVNRPRVIAEPETLVTYAGREAIQARLVDLNRTEQLTILMHPETLQTLATIQS